jgi:hypothetical protein
MAKFGSISNVRSLCCTDSLYRCAMHAAFSCLFKTARLPDISKAPPIKTSPIDRQRIKEDAAWVKSILLSPLNIPIDDSEPDNSKASYKHDDTITAKAAEALPALKPIVKRAIAKHDDDGPRYPPRIHGGRSTYSQPNQ